MIEYFSDDDRPRQRPGLLAAAAAAAFGMALCLTVLFLGMRTVMMTEGGFVAVGGPYVIAHPAPGWIWVVPVSIVIGMLLGFAHAALSNVLGGFDLAIPGWSATFLALGWNFLELGLRGPQGGVVWGWLICGIVFVPMGLIPLWFVYRGWGVRRISSESLALVRPGEGGSVWRDRAAAAGAVYTLVHLAALAGGVAAGWLFFRFVAG